MNLIGLFFALLTSATISMSGVFVEPKNNENQIILVQNSTESSEFLEYWYSDFRQTPTCDVTYPKFKEMYGKYTPLSYEDKIEVNAKPADLEMNGNQYTIGDVITTLVNKFNSVNDGGDDKKQKLDQSTMIAIVSGVAIFGISTILVFYILKSKKIIK